MYNLPSREGCQDNQDEDGKEEPTESELERIEEELLRRQTAEAILFVTGKSDHRLHMHTYRQDLILESFTKKFGRKG